jgi:hypothetical protein
MDGAFRDSSHRKVEKEAAEIAVTKFADWIILTVPLSQNFRFLAGRELPPGCSLA